MGCLPTKRSRCRHGAHSSSCFHQVHQRRRAWPFGCLSAGCPCASCCTNTEESSPSSLFFAVDISRSYRLPTLHPHHEVPAPVNNNEHAGEARTGEWAYLGARIFMAPRDLLRPPVQLPILWRQVLKGNVVAGFALPGVFLFLSLLVGHIINCRGLPGVGKSEMQKSRNVRGSIKSSCNGGWAYVLRLWDSSSLRTTVLGAKAGG